MPNTALEHFSTCDVEKCSKAVHDWFLWNGLALNPDKAEVLLLGSAAKLRHINFSNDFNIAGADVSLVNPVKSLCVTTDSHQTFDKYVSNICQDSYFHSRAFWHVRSSMLTEIAKYVASAIVGARLDYCNSLLY